MKVAIITNHSYMLYQFRKELINTLLKDNEVTLLMPYVGHEEDFMNMGCNCINVEIDRRGINPVTDIKLLKKYYELLKDIQPDYVITYSIKPNIYAGLVCSLLHIPYFANVQGLGTAFQRKGLAKFVTLLYSTAFSKVNCVFFENEGNRQEFLTRNIVPISKTHVLNGAGVNLDHYNTNVEMTRDNIHFIFVGRIMKEKGIDELFSAFRTISQEYDNILLDVVGPFEDDYKDVIEEMKNIKGFVFHGFQTDVRPFVENAHCLVLPSYHEGMANTILEVASMNRAVIASNIPGCKEGIIDGVTGYLVEKQNSKDVYNKMKMFIELSYEDKVSMGKAGRKYMEEKFDKVKVVEDTVNTIKRIGGL